MLTAINRYKTIVARLFALLLVFAAPISAAKPFTIRAALEIFPSYETYNNRGWTLRIEDCPCVLISDRRQIIHYIVIFPPENIQRSAKRLNKAKQVGERLTAYLTQKFCNAELMPFEDGKSGYIVALENTNTFQMTSSILGETTVKAIRKLQEDDGVFIRCQNNGHITLELPCPLLEDVSAFVTFSLLDGNVSMVILDLKDLTDHPHRKEEEEKEKLIRRTAWNVAEKLLDTSLYRELSEHPKGHFFTEHDYGIDCRSICRYYIGDYWKVREYLSYASRDAFIGEFAFPNASAKIPKLQKSDHGKSTNEKSEESSESTTSVAVLCKHFGYKSPVVKDGIAHFHLQNCRVVIPVPNKDGANLQTRLSLPFTAIFIGCDYEENQKDIHIYADALLKILNISKSSATISKSSDGVGKIILSSKQPIDQEKLVLALVAKEFADAETHNWPDRTITGKPLSDALKAVINKAAVRKRKTSPAQNGGNITPTWENAMKDYIEYLHHLMNEGGDAS